MAVQTHNTTTGFSQRFSELLDRANFPKKGRSLRGAERFGVSSSAFHQWLTADQPPRNYDSLVEYVQTILLDIIGEHDPHAVACWLLGGAAVPHPFEEGDIDFILKADIYLMVNTQASERGIQIAPNTAKEITYRLYHYVSDQRKQKQLIGSIRSNPIVIEIIKSALVLEEAGIR